MTDQKDVLGLGFVGAMVFVIALALILLVGLPLITSDAGALGFLGNILGALGTLIAAGIAWRAVQRQIAAQRVIADRQSAVQEFVAIEALLAGHFADLRLMHEVHNAFVGLNASLNLAALRNEPAFAARIKAEHQSLANLQEKLFVQSGRPGSYITAGTRYSLDYYMASAGQCVREIGYRQKMQGEKFETSLADVFSRTLFEERGGKVDQNLETNRVEITHAHDFLKWRRIEAAKAARLDMNEAAN